MAFIAANGGKTAYGVKKFFLDTAEDLMQLNTANLYPGSTAFIINTSTTYMLNNKKVWVKVDLGSGGSSGDGDLPDHVIYDGGVVTG